MIIEELYADEDEVINLIGMFDEMVTRLQMVRAKPIVVDISEGDPEAIERWYEDLESRDWSHCL